MISKCVSDDIPLQMKILNMVIPIIMHFCSLVSNWSVASRIEPHIIQRNVTYLIMSNYFRQYIAGYTVAIYKSKCIRRVFPRLILLFLVQCM